MPSSTSRGYRYMVDGDPLGDVAVATENLANDIESKLKRIESGTVTSASLAAGTSGDVTVTFGSAFAAAPKMALAIVVNGSDPSLFTAMVKTKSTTGAVLRVKNGSGSSVAIPVDWIAQG